MGDDTTYCSFCDMAVPHAGHECNCDGARAGRLEAKLASVEMELDDLRAKVERYNHMAGQDADTLANLRAREARLAEALQLCGAVISRYDGDSEDPSNQVERAMMLTDAAFSSTDALAWLEEEKRKARALGAAEALEAQGCTCGGRMYEQPCNDECAVTLAAAKRKEAQG
jgi:hypothetical protein